MSENAVPPVSSHRVIATASWGNVMRMASAHSFDVSRLSPCTTTERRATLVARASVTKLLPSGQTPQSGLRQSGSKSTLAGELVVADYTPLIE